MRNLRGERQGIKIAEPEQPEIFRFIFRHKLHSFRQGEKSSGSQEVFKREDREDRKGGREGHRFVVLGVYIVCAWWF
jgi:hypothetical protein